MAPKVAPQLNKPRNTAKKMEEEIPTLPPLPRAKISVAIDPIALVTTECITVTSAMRKNARWAQSSVSAILGGGGGSGLIGAGVNPNSGMSTPVPGSPAGLHGRRGGAKGVLEELNGDVGLAGRWGLRGKKGKSIQVCSVMSPEL